MWSERGPLRYERLTCPEVRRAAAEERVALVPVATLEDLGPHPHGGRAGTVVSTSGAVTVRYATVGDAPALGRVHVRAWQAAAYRRQMPDDYLDGLRRCCGCCQATTARAASTRSRAGSRMAPNAPTRSWAWWSPRCATGGDWSVRAAILLWVAGRSRAA